MMLPANFKQYYEDGVNLFFDRVANSKDMKPEYTWLFKTDKSRRRAEVEVQNTGFPVAPVRPIGGDTYFATAQTGYINVFAMETIAMGFEFAMETIDDDRYGDPSRRAARWLASSMFETRELKAARVIDMGYSTDAKIGNSGTPLFSDSHRNTDGSTYSNVTPTPMDFSWEALETSCIQIAKFEDDQGLNQNLMPEGVLIPADQEFEAIRIFKSMNQNYTNDNDINAIRVSGKFPKGYHVMRRLSNPDFWMVKTKLMDGGFKFYRRMNLKRGIDGDFTTDAVRYKSVERYAVGVSAKEAGFASSQ